MDTWFYRYTSGQTDKQMMIALGLLCTSTDGKVAISCIVLRCFPV